MKLRVALMIGSCLVASCVWSHPPHGHEQKHKHLVEADPDVLGNAQNMLPLSYRARKNRPTFFGGMIAYWISPTSLEALSWHENRHRGSYWPPHQPPVCKKYYYPKPWEVIPIGPRNCQASSDPTSPSDMLEPVPEEVIVPHGQLERSPIQ